MSRTKQQWINATGGFPLKNLLFASPVKITKPEDSAPCRMVVFDIETERISKDFQYAKKEAKIQHAPSPVVACTYCSKSRRYQYYEKKDFKLLLKQLQEADEVISFNGINFDYLVIANTLKRKTTNFKFKKSRDLFQILLSETGRFHSLHNLSVLNIGVGKYEKGYDIPNLDIKEIKKACKSDVSQTYKLYRLYLKGKLLAPSHSLSKRDYLKMPFGGICPSCKDTASIVTIDYDIDELTEGQLFHYLNGEFGTMRCTTCGIFITWG